MKTKLDAAQERIGTAENKTGDRGQKGQEGLERK